MADAKDLVINSLEDLVLFLEETYDPQDVVVRMIKERDDRDLGEISGRVMLAHEIIDLIRR
jgi:hypothetical protein